MLCWPDPAVLLPHAPHTPFLPHPALLRRSPLSCPSLLQPFFHLFLFFLFLLYFLVYSFFLSFSLSFFPYLVWFFHSFALGSFLECFFSSLFLCPQEPQPCQRPQHLQHPQCHPCPQHPHNPSVPHILSVPICLASTAPPIPSIPLSPASWPCSRRTWLTNPPLLQPIGAVSGPRGPQQSLCGPEPRWQGPAETPSPPPWVRGHPRDTS